MNEVSGAVTKLGMDGVEFFGELRLQLAGALANRGKLVTQSLDIDMLAHVGSPTYLVGYFTGRSTYGYHLC